MIDIIYRVMFGLLIFKLLMTMYQRKYNENGGKKRLISLYQSLLLGVMYIASSAILGKGYDPNFLYLVIVITIIIGILLRKTLFPYVSRCEKCGKKLNIEHILFIDGQICQKCEI